MNKFKKITIRPMLLKDLPHVLKVEATRDDFLWSEDVFRDCINAGCECIVGEKNNHLVAYAIMFFLQDEARVFNVCVVPEEQSKGYGRFMMQQLLAAARKKKVKKIVLKVRETKQHIQKFYCQLGFRLVNRLQDYYDLPIGKDSALVFELRMSLLS